MRRLTIALTACLAVMTCITGCDFFRAVAGRPTSEDIRAKRELIRAEQFRQQKKEALSEQIDERPVPETEQNVMANLATLGCPYNSYSKFSGRLLSQMEYRFYIILGAFSVAENAENLLVKIRDAGYKACALNYRNGQVAVAVSPCNEIGELVAAYAKVREEPFCPADAWILFKD